MSFDRIPGTVDVAALRCGAGTARVERCHLIDEAPLFVEVQGVGRYALMWTPTEFRMGAAGFVAGEGWLGDGEPSAALSLATGFAFSEGLFDDIAEIESIARCPQAPDVVRIELAPPARARAAAQSVRSVRTLHSSCGACGGEEVGQLLRGVSPVHASTVLSLRALHGLASTMQRRQSLWQATGAAHAALLFTADGEIVTIAEDLGRHNALDKAIGRCLLVGHRLEGCGAIVSSRLSFEMVAKAARARLAIVAGVSAASSLAVRSAHACGLTLCGLLRNGGATVHTHPQRILVDAPDRVALPEPTPAA